MRQFVDNRGKLIAGEYPDQLPFTPVRFFAISNVPAGELRGQHAHKSNQQILVCLSGGLALRLHDGEKWERYCLKPNGEGVLVPPLHFGEISTFEPETTLLVLASEVYDPDEYIHDFDMFLKSFS
jgi:dTDP-4-dehydrorhamnose 3,5-epimerase-like enzyme